MKFKYILGSLATLAASMLFTACEDEKDLIIIEGNLPIKASALYMVGDATPNGWSIDSPTPLTVSAEDALVFEWEGTLNTGEMKLCLTTGSWDAPFIRPVENGREIGEEAIVNEVFQMHAGDPDEKWRITTAGIYSLTFDLRNWSMSTRYIGAAQPEEQEPIETENLYIVGSATPAGWNIEAPVALEKTSAYIFVYEGDLNTGELKACTEAGSWDVKFIRPASAGVKISKDGVESNELVYTTGPDNKWEVADAGKYRLTFDLQNLTINSEFLAEAEPLPDIIETETLYLIGDATPGGWNMDNLTALTRDSDNKYIFSWKGQLVGGSMKACIAPDGSFSCPFLRPARPDVTISSAGVEEPGFVYTTAPDDQWKITEAGIYTITFDLENKTISAVMDNEDPTPDPDPDIIDTNTLYIIGDATPGGWSMDNLTALTQSDSDKYVFTWKGSLKTGNMKACIAPDGSFACPFLRPARANVKISSDGVEEPGFVYTTDPDDQWVVTEAGVYTLTFNLKEKTISAVKDASGTTPDPDAIETSTLYIIGDATPGGWSMDNLTALKRDNADKYIFTWEGKLTKGSMKACIAPDGTFSCPFIRPARADVKISSAGVEEPGFVYTTDPDDKWAVTDAGNYRLTFNLSKRTISAEWLGK